MPLIEKKREKPFVRLMANAPTIVPFVRYHALYDDSSTQRGQGNSPGDWQSRCCSSQEGQASRFPQEVVPHQTLVHTLASLPGRMPVEASSPFPACVTLAPGNTTYVTLTKVKFRPKTILILKNI